MTPKVRAGGELQVPGKQSQGKGRSDIKNKAEVKVRVNQESGSESVAQEAGKGKKTQSASKAWKGDSSLTRPARSEIILW